MLDELSKLAIVKPKLDKWVELAETPKPFLGVCVCGRCLCCNKGVELAEMPEPFLGFGIRGLLCRAASPVIVGGNVRNSHTNHQFEANGSREHTAGRHQDCACVCGGCGGSGGIGIWRRGGRSLQQCSVAQRELGLMRLCEY
jgi:hypothetical protein